MPDDADSARPPYNRGRVALLAAAVRVVARDGLRGLTYRAVATESQTTHGLISYHFGSRERLIRETLQYASEQASISAPIGSGGVDALVASLPQMGEEAAADHAFVFELTLEARRRPELRPTIAGLYENFRELTGVMLEREGIEDPDGALSRAVFAAVDGLTLQHLVDQDSSATEAALKALARLLEGHAHSTYAADGVAE